MDGFDDYLNVHVRMKYCTEDKGGKRSAPTIVNFTTKSILSIPKTLAEKWLQQEGLYKDKKMVLLSVEYVTSKICEYKWTPPTRT